MKTISTRRRAAALLVSVGLGLGACGGMEKSADRRTFGIETSAEMQSFLEDARTTSNEYGQKHLGHYLKLDEKALRKLDLDVPAGTRIEIQTDHEGYCIKAISDGVDEEDKWSTATVSSGIGGVSSDDRCSK